MLPKHRRFCLNTGKTQGILPNFVSSSCQCSDSKSKGYCDSGRKKNLFFSRSWIGLPSQFCVCNTHKLCKLAQGKFAVGQGNHRENTGNLKIQFEWVPCQLFPVSLCCVQKVSAIYVPISGHGLIPGSWIMMRHV